VVIEARSSVTAEGSALPSIANVKPDGVTAPGVCPSCCRTVAGLDTTRRAIAGRCARTVAEPDDLIETVKAMKSTRRNTTDFMAVSVSKVDVAPYSGSIGLEQPTKGFS